MNAAGTLGVGLLGVLAIMPVPADADEVNGELLFYRHCHACHSLEAGKNSIGPSLFAVYGRRSASLDGYVYSDALKRLGLRWSEEYLDVYVTDAQQFAPGSKMLAKFPDAKTRQDIVEFLRAQPSTVE